MAKAKKFIQGAIKHPGALTKKAKGAGQTVTAYCNNPNLSGKSKQQCNLAKTLKSF